MAGRDERALDAYKRLADYFDASQPGVQSSLVIASRLPFGGDAQLVTPIAPQPRQHQVLHDDQRDPLTRSPAIGTPGPAFQRRPRPRSADPASCRRQRRRRRGTAPAPVESVAQDRSICRRSSLADPTAGA